MDVRPVAPPPELANHPQYELRRELGRGGMGVVYLAHNRMMDRDEVLKVVNKAVFDHPDAAERFLREIRAAARLNHPNVVTAYSAFQAGDLLILAMEYVPGDDLGRLVAARGPLGVPSACYYAYQAAQGLQHAHDRGMVHRDIKPDNLILAKDGKKRTVKVLDFGLAKATSEESAQTALTGAGRIIGTPEYIAPEQTRAAAAADIRADVYSLGCTLFFLLAGRPPFQSPSLYDLLHQHQEADPPPLDRVRGDVPPELAAVVARMLAKDPAERFPTPAQVALALAPFFKPGGPTGSHHVLPAVRDAELVDTAEAAPVPRVTVIAPGAALPARTAYLNADDFGPPPKPEKKPRKTRRHRHRPDNWWVRPAILGGVAVALLVAGVAGMLLPGKPKDQAAANPDPPTTKPDPPPPPPPQKPGFEKLFNGANLDGWKKVVVGDGGGEWTFDPVEKAIVGDGARCLLLYERRKFADVHVRAEVKYDRGNSGLFVRATGYLPAYTPGSTNGYEAAVVRGSDAAHRIGTLWKMLGVRSRHWAPTEVRQPPPGEWFNLDLKAVGRRVEVLVDNQPTTGPAGVTDDDSPAMDGYVGLKMLAPGTRVKFRNIEAQELTAPEGVRAPSPPPTPPAPAAVLLFDGTNLNGLVSPPFNAGTWAVENGLLVGRGGPAGLAHLWTGRPVARNFRIKMELPTGQRDRSASAVYLRGAFDTGKPTGYAITVTPTRPDPNARNIPRGSIRKVVRGEEKGAADARPRVGAPAAAATYTVEVTVKDNIVTTFVNGLEAATLPDPDPLPAGVVWLVCAAGDELRFKSIELTELP